jgi:hypothetical protein
VSAARGVRAVREVSATTASNVRWDIRKWDKTKSTIACWDADHRAIGSARPQPCHGSWPQLDGLSTGVFSRGSGQRGKGRG